MTCLSEFALDDLVIHGNGGGASAPHVTACTRCQRRAAARQAAQEGFRVVGPPLWPAVLAGRRARRFWRRPFLMAPLALAGALAFVLVARAPPPSPYSGAKGGQSLSIVVRRGDEVFALDAARRAQAGDALRFLPAAPSDFRFVAIVSVDGRGYVTYFYPSSGEDRSVPLPPAGQALPGSIVLDDAPGPERLLVALTDRPIIATELRTAALSPRAESRASQFGGAKALLFWTTIEKEPSPRGTPGAP